MSTSVPKFASVEEGVYRFLREEILEARVQPNERLRLEELAARLEVSLTPVRQALRRLESDDLVVSPHRRSARVAPLLAEEVEEIQAIRAGVETRLARLGVIECTDATIREIEHWRDRMERAFERGDLRGYVKTFWPFKDPCYRLADRPRLLRVTDAQRVRVERYVLFLCKEPSGFAGLRTYQDSFLDACRARDPDAVEASTREGAEWVLTKIQRLLTESKWAAA